MKDGPITTWKGKRGCISVVFPEGKKTKKKKKKKNNVRREGEERVKGVGCNDKPAWDQRKSNLAQRRGFFKKKESRGATNPRTPPVPCASAGEDVKEIIQGEAKKPPPPGEKPVTQPKNNPKKKNKANLSRPAGGRIDRNTFGLPLKEKKKEEVLSLPSNNATGT